MMDRDNGDKLIEQAKSHLSETNPLYYKEVERDTPEVLYWMGSFAAEQVRAERERIADELEGFYFCPDDAEKMADLRRELRGEG